MLSGRTSAAIFLLLALAATCAAGQESLRFVPSRGHEEYDLTFLAPDLRALDGYLALNYADEGNFLKIQFSQGRCQALAIVGGKARALTPSVPLPAAENAPVLVQRRKTFVRVYANHELVLRAGESRLRGGKIASLFAGFEPEIRYQAVEEFYFTDDFMRLPGEQSIWQPIFGRWALAHAEGEASHSANPFMFQAQGNEPCLVVGGSPYWSDYRLCAAVRSAGSDIGLVAYYVDRDNYILFRMTSQLSPADDADRRQLILVRGGRRTVLADERGGFLPGQWYRLELRICEQRVEAAVDGLRVLRVAGFRYFGRGPVGLYAGPGPGALFDDVSVQPWDYLSEEFADPSLPLWEKSDDGWRTAPVAGRKDALRRAALSAGMALAGDFTWNGYTFSADVLPQVIGGLVFNFHDEQNYAICRWAKAGVDVPFAGKMQVARIVEGKEEVLAEIPNPLSPDRWQRISLTTADDLVRVFVGGKLTFELLEGKLRAGRIGLYAWGNPAACFDRVRVSFPEPNPAEEVAARFAREDTMREWASVAGQWVRPEDPERDVWWNKGDFFGDTKVVVDLQSSLTGGSALDIALCAEGRSTDDAYRFTLAQRPREDLSLYLRRRGALVGQATIARGELPVQLVLARRGSLVTAAVDGQTRILFVDPQPLSGPKVGVQLNGVKFPLSRVVAHATEIFDYTFSSAPTDWIARTGLWDITSRWTCQKEWSWFSAISEQTAVLWSKRAFDGDITVELYAAMKMGAARFGAGYKHPHDINITICGDGFNTSSGYTFTVGGYLNSPTQIRRGAQVLAETWDEQATLPSIHDGLPQDMNRFHRHWWQVRAVKRGPLLQLYLDNKLVLQTRDPHPLPGGHVALWTWNNGIMVARAKIYGRAQPGRLLPSASRIARLAARVKALPRPELEIRSPTHPALFCDFEGHAYGWRGADGKNGAIVAVDPTEAASGKASLAICNENCGGTFAAVFPQPFRPIDLPKLAFDYKVPPEVNVNITLRGEEQDFCIAFCGGADPGPGELYLGQIRGVVQDNRWRHAEFDILAQLRRLDPSLKLAQGVIREIVFQAPGANHDLLRGYLGNPAHATYHIDNFALYKPGPEAAQFVFAAQGGLGAISYVVDDNPTTVPDLTAEATEPRAVINNLTRDGVYFLHARGKLADGRWTGARHYAFFVDASPPRLIRFWPGEGGRTPGYVSFSVEDAGAGVDPGTVHVELEGRMYSLSDPALRFDPEAGEIRLALAGGHTAVAPGQQVRVRLAQVGDYLGHLIQLPTAFTVTLDPTLDREPPPAPRIVSGGPFLVNNTFEQGTVGQWRPTATTTGAKLSVDWSTAATGRASLRLYNPATSTGFGAVAWAKPFDAGKYRILSFDYKIGPWLRVDLHVFLAADRRFRTIKFTDTDSSYEVIGKIPNVIADNRWHHAEINLFEMLRRALPGLTDFTVLALHFRGTGQGTNPEDMWYNIDNFKITALASPRPALNLRLAAEDDSGIKGASFVLDDSPTTTPDLTLDSAGQTLVLSDLPSGQRFLHVRLQDNAGNWGPTSHFRLLLDSDPIQVAEVSPRPGAVACTDEIRILLRDAGPAGVNPATVRLAVNGQEYRAGEQGVQFDPQSGVLRWKAGYVEPPMFLPDKQEVTVALLSAEDFAGNGLAQPVRFAWKMDYSLDDQPPEPPRIASPTHPLALFDTFDGDVGEWEGLGLTQLALDPRVKRSGAASLRVVAPAQGEFGVVARKTPFSANNCPYLEFDYRISREAQVDLVFVVAGHPIPVNFTDAEPGAVFRIPGVVPDNRWHHARFNLLSLASQLAAMQVRVLGGRRAGPLVIERILFLDRGARETPPGASFHIDNFAVVGPSNAHPVFSWRASDATGIAGYSVAFDDRPDTVPPRRVNVRETNFRPQRKPAPGRWFLHVRALDGTGHWSAPAHYPIVQSE